MPVAQTQNTDLSIGLLAGQAQLIEFPVAGRSGPEPTQLPSDCVSDTSCFVMSKTAYWPADKDRLGFHIWTGSVSHPQMEW